MANTQSQDKFRTRPLADLARQLHYAPKTRQVEQLERAERLHDEIDAEATYPFDYIAYRITHIRPGGGETVLLVGEAARADLRLIIDDLSRRYPPRRDAAPTFTTDQLATHWRVSSRTINRWRNAGLRWRWVQTGAARPRIGFTQQAVDHFAAQQADRVEQAGRFNHLTDAERDRLLRRARRIASVTETTPHQVAGHLAPRTGRGVETIRQLLETHDRAHPDQRIFVNHTAPLTPRQQRVIGRAFRRGVPVGQIARRYRRSRASIYRVINERRAIAAQRIELRYIDSPTFNRDDADEVLLRPNVEDEALAHASNPGRATIDALPGALQPLYDQPIVPDRRQRFLLQRYNYLKRQATHLREQFDRHHPRARDLDAFDARVQHARLLRELLLRTNLSTVLSLARRHLLDKPDPGQQRLWHLLALGHRVLAEAIETYDPARSQGFSAYLSNRLMRRFANDPRASEAEPAKAHRRLSGEQALGWLMQDAEQAGVRLPDVSTHGVAGDVF